MDLQNEFERLQNNFLRKNEEYIELHKQVKTVKELEKDDTLYKLSTCYYEYIQSSLNYYDFIYKTVNKK